MPDTGGSRKTETERWARDGGRKMDTGALEVTDRKTDRPKVTGTKSERRTHRDHLGDTKGDRDQREGVREEEKASLIPRLRDVGEIQQQTEQKGLN